MSRSGGGCGMRARLGRAWWAVRSLWAWGGVRVEVVGAGDILVRTRCSARMVFFGGQNWCISEGRWCSCLLWAQRKAGGLPRRPAMGGFAQRCRLETWLG